MRSLKLGLLGFLVVLSACGSSKPATSLAVHCNGELTLAGGQSIDVTSDSGKGTVLSFPDPVNAGHTGIIPIPAGQKCTITPQVNVGG